MSKQSEPEKERLNIRYKPATGDYPEGVELPLKLLMVGNYTLREDDTPVEDLQVIEVKSTNFGKVMSEQNLTLETDVENRIAGKGRLDVRLTFDSLSAFSPDSIVQQVPELKQLMDLRDALNALSRPLENKAAFRKAIEKVLADPNLRDHLRKELGLTTESANKP